MHEDGYTFRTQVALPSLPPASCLVVRWGRRYTDGALGIPSIGSLKILHVLHFLLLLLQLLAKAGDKNDRYLPCKTWMTRTSGAEFIRRMSGYGFEAFQRLDLSRCSVISTVFLLPVPLFVSK